MNGRAIFLAVFLVSAKKARSEVYTLTSDDNWWGAKTMTIKLSDDKNKIKAQSLKTFTLFTSSVEKKTVQVIDGKIEFTTKKRWAVLFISGPNGQDMRKGSVENMVDLTKTRQQSVDVVGAFRESQSETQPYKSILVKNRIPHSLPLPGNRNVIHVERKSFKCHEGELITSAALDQPKKRDGVQDEVMVYPHKDWTAFYYKYKVTFLSKDDGGDDGNNGKDVVGNVRGDKLGGRWWSLEYSFETEVKVFSNCGQGKRMLKGSPETECKDEGERKTKGKQILTILIIGLVALASAIGVFLWLRQKRTKSDDDIICRESTLEREMAERTKRHFKKICAEGAKAMEQQ